MYTTMQKINLISQTSLELFKFQESWNLIGWEQAWACLGVSDQNQEKRLFKFVSSNNDELMQKKSNYIL